MKIQNVLFIFLTAYVLCLSLAYIFKVRLMVVTSNSMKPEFEFGDVLLAKSQEHYSPKEIISYKIDNTIITHRVFALHTSSPGKKLYETKGDANKSSDLNLVTQKQIIGKVIYILPKVGYLILFIQSKYMSLGLVVVFIVFFSSQVIKKLNSFFERSYEK